MIRDGEKNRVGKKERGEKETKGEKSERNREGPRGFERRGGGGGGSHLPQGHASKSQLRGIQIGLQPTPGCKITLSRSG